MKTSVLFVIAAAAVAAAAPAPEGRGRCQFNQYDNKHDCYKNQNKKYYNYPEQGRCYDMQNHDYLSWSNGGNVYGYHGYGCNGQQYPIYEHEQCMHKGKYNSYKLG